MSRVPDEFTTRSRVGIIVGVCAVLIVFAVLLNSPTVIRNMVGAVGYSGEGGWTATGTMGGQDYNATWSPTNTGYNVSGSAGGNNFNYTVDGSFPGISLSGSVQQWNHFGHNDGLVGQNVRAPDNGSVGGQGQNIMCSSGQYMCGLHYDWYQNELTIEPVCCST